MGVRVGFSAAAFLLLAACNSSGQAKNTGSPVIALPDSATCGQAVELRDGAAEHRRRGVETSSDQEGLLLASRANFLASLAVVADLRCVGAPPEAEDALQLALQSARNAEETTGFYAQASAWTEANLAATGVIEILVQRLHAQIDE